MRKYKLKLSLFYIDPVNKLKELFLKLKVCVGGKCPPGYPRYDRPCNNPMELSLVSITVFRKNNSSKNVFRINLICLIKTTSARSFIEFVNY